MSLYSCKIEFKAKRTGVNDVFRYLFQLVKIDSQYKTHLFYNEFDKDKSGDYDLDFVLDNLSKKELDGLITCATFNHKSNKGQPGISIKLRLSDSTLANEYTTFDVEWYNLPSVKFIENHLVILDELTKKDVIPTFLIAYNNNDAIQQSSKWLDGDISAFYSRMVVVYGKTFIAAPLMIFGNSYFEIVPVKKLLNYSSAKKIEINNQIFVICQLFGLHDNPELHREAQKQYWSDLNMEKWIKRYQNNKQKFIRKNGGFYRRIEKYKARKRHDY